MVGCNEDKVGPYSALSSGLSTAVLSGRFPVDKSCRSISLRTVGAQHELTATPVFRAILKSKIVRVFNHLCDNYRARSLMLWYASMKPSEALQTHRTELREIVTRHGALRPRVFGSAISGNDTELIALRVTSTAWNLRDLRGHAHTGRGHSQHRDHR